jgi:hypothetical protein
MSYRVITIVYTRRKLSALEIAEQKKYLFICEHEVRIGDMIDSPTYATPCQVIDVTYKNSKPMNPRGQFLKTLVIDKINGKSIYSDYVNEPVKVNQMKNNSMFSGIMAKYSGQFIPEKEEKVRMSLSGLLCVPQDGEYVGVDNAGNLVSFPEEMTLPIPVYSIVKANSAVIAGDIIKNGNSYSKVIAINPDGSLKVLSFTGYTHNKKPVTDFIMGAATTRVLINMFNFDEKSGFNPIFFAMASGETIDVNSLMMLSMTPQGKNLFSNAGGGFNPAMLWMLDKSRQEGNGGGMDMMSMMMMSSMMGGQNPFGQMFNMGGAASVSQTPVTTATQANVPTTPTVDEAVNVILNNPDAIAKLKDALKDA